MLNIPKKMTVANLVRHITEKTGPSNYYEEKSNPESPISGYTVVSGRWLGAFAGLVLNKPGTSLRLQKHGLTVAARVCLDPARVGAATQRRCWPDRHLTEFPIQLLEQLSGIEAETVGDKFKGLLVSEVTQASRQFGDLGHLRSIDQNRDHTNATRERRLNLQPHEVLGVVQAPLPAFAGDRQPPCPNHRQKHRAGPNRGHDHLNEVVPQLDRIDISENLALAEVVNQPVKQPSGRVGSIFPPVADKDPAVSQRSSCGHHCCLTRQCRIWGRSGDTRLS